MAWIDFVMPDVEQLAVATLLNSMKDDINYLHASNAASYYHPGTGGNYTVTGSLGVEVDNTNFNLTIVTSGGPVLAGFYGNVGTSDTSTSCRLNILHVDSISHIGRNLFSNFAAEVTSPLVSAVPVVNGQPVGFFVSFPDLPAGSHTFKLVWGVSGGGTGTLYVALRPTMWVTEF